ncbi:hypothetical protein JAK45_14640 [Stenotrophomonas maltophilia]|nr:hypothetical protein [Stenotrophomonas maltophilia]
MLAEHMIGGIEDEGTAGSSIGTLSGHGLIFGQDCPFGETVSDGIVRLLSYAHLCDGCVMVAERYVESPWLPEGAVDPRHAWMSIWSGWKLARGLLIHLSSFLPALDEINELRLMALKNTTAVLLVVRFKYCVGSIQVPGLELDGGGESVHGHARSFAFSIDVSGDHRPRSGLLKLSGIAIEDSYSIRGNLAVVISRFRSGIMSRLSRKRRSVTAMSPASQAVLPHLAIARKRSSSSASRLGAMQVFPLSLSIGLTPG